MAEIDHKAFMSHALLWAENAETLSSPDLELEDENGLTVIDLAEASILSHAPENSAQMIVQLEIIAQDLGEGARYDGLDLHAIRGIQRALIDTRLAGDGEFSRFAAIRLASGKFTESPFGGTGLGLRN
ncbi:hypothetical protein [Brevundimonas goettingensis]|jgi:hypothetical protein|uniref:Uncharacterized protein n=1 Tax=Brevundimonas goettingensis TaxID=2774190 RepID=A0A975C327_9CAUL|nr:hypothetical protein [Brevundimonas goettingensis]QTC90426.1 hypothetical protein IFJ75_14235 [Brevundimonas goettingensis]